MAIVTPYLLCVASLLEAILMFSGTAEMNRRFISCYPGLSLFDDEILFGVVRLPHEGPRRRAGGCDDLKQKNVQASTSVNIDEQVMGLHLRLWWRERPVWYFDGPVQRLPGRYET